MLYIYSVLKFILKPYCCTPVDNFPFWVLTGGCTSVTVTPAAAAADSICGLNANQSAVSSLISPTTGGTLENETPVAVVDALAHSGILSPSDPGRTTTEKSLDSKMLESAPSTLHEPQAASHTTTASNSTTASSKSNQITSDPKPASLGI